MFALRFDVRVAGERLLKFRLQLAVLVEPVPGYFAAVFVTIDYASVLNVLIERDRVRVNGRWRHREVAASEHQPDDKHVQREHDYSGKIR